MVRSFTVSSYLKSLFLFSCCLLLMGAGKVLAQPVATLVIPDDGAKTSIHITFDRQLEAATTNITVASTLISSLRNDRWGGDAAIAVPGTANSVTWNLADINAPIATVTIPSTTFVRGQTVRMVFQNNAVQDQATSTPIPNGTAHYAVVSGIHVIDFESTSSQYFVMDNPGALYTDGDDRYFNVFSDATEGGGGGDDHNLGTAISNPQLQYLAQEDLGNHTGITAGTPASFSSPDLNIANYANLELRFYLAATGTGYESGQDFVKFEYSVDNGAFTIAKAFSGATGGVFEEDANNDGIQDGSATDVPSSLTEYTVSLASIPTSATTLKIRVRSFNSAGDEEFVFDNIRIIGDDDTGPAVVSIVRADPNPTTAADVDYTVTFNEIVTGVAAADFALTLSGVTATVNTVTASPGLAFNVNVNTIAGDGTLRLDVAGGATVNDLSGNALGAGFSGEVYTIDNNAPAGYTVSIDQAIINAANETALSFTFAGAEIGADYDYSIDDSNGGTPPIAGTGTIASATQQISGINVSSLDDGTLTLTVFLTDQFGHQGADATDNVTKDTEAPAGYTVSIDQPVIFSGNETALSFTFAGAQVGADYDYSIDDTDGGTTPITGSGTIATATDVISGIDVSSLTDGTLTLTVTLTDPAGNEGLDATDNVTKDTAPPVGYTVSIDQAAINEDNQGALSFTFSGAEVGADYEYSIDDTDGGTTAISGSGTIATATDVISGIDVSTLIDGTLTLTVYLTDINGNQGGDVTDNVAKDVVDPAGYSVSINPAIVTQANQAAFAFTFAGAEVGAGYNYSIDDTDGGTTPIAGSGTIAAATDVISGIDVTSLSDGVLTLTVYLTDPAGNQGGDVTDNVNKDATSPNGYSVSINQAVINAANQNALSFTFAGAEVTADYDYSIDDTNGGTPPVTGGGTIGAPNDVISGINVSSLDDDVLTLTVYLTDVNGNQGGDVTDNVTKDVVPPTVADIVRTTGDPNPNSTGTVHFDVTFSKPVNNVDVTDFDTHGSASGGGEVISDVTGSGDTYTVEVSGIVLTGQLGLTVLDDNSILDDAGNPLNGGLSSTETFEIVVPEPLNHATAFAIAPAFTTTTAMRLTWTDAAGTPTPSGYLITIEKGSATADVPTDGDVIANQTNLINNNTGYINVNAGVQFVDLIQLRSGQTYTFRIYPYTNSGANIDYKIDGVVPMVSGSTPVAADADIGLYGIGNTTIPSVGAANVNFRFYIYDQAFGVNDNADLRVSSIIIRKNNALDQIADWTQAIESAELSEAGLGGEISGAPARVATGADITASTITFSNLLSDAFGVITYNAAGYKYYDLKITLKASLGGNLPQTIDGLRINLQLNTTDITLGAGSTTFGVNKTINESNAVVDVDATRLDFTTHPGATQLVFTNVTSASVAPDFATVPVVRARDANGNTDLHYNNTFTVSNAGALPMQGLIVAPPNSISVSNGVGLFPANFQYGDDGNGTLTVTDGVLTNGVSNAVTVNYGNTSTITPGAFAEAPTISSTQNAGFVRVFDFNVVDDNGAGGDGSPTRISQIVITPGTGNDITTWSDVIQQAILFDGINQLLGTVNAGNITFAGINTASLGLVADNSAKDYQLYLTIRPSMGGTYPTTVDNQNFVFEVLDENITLHAQSSLFTGSESENSGPANIAVDVDATTLVFATQPPADVLVNANLTTSPVVHARDINGNRDLDFISPVVVSNTGGLGMINPPAAFAAGVLTFPANFQYTQVGNGTLTVSSAGVTPAVSSAVTVRVAKSTTITAGVSAEPATISSLTNTAPGVQVFDFTLNDDAGSEDDGNPTQVDHIFIISGIGDEIDDFNWLNAVAGATLTDGTNTVSAVINSTYFSFDLSTLAGQALGLVPDNGSKTLRLNIWLHSALGGSLPANIDGLNFQFEVVAGNVITDAAGSSVINTESENSGASNEVTVVATQLDITSPSAATSVSINTAFNPVIAARDANGNRDLDFAGAAATVREFTNASGATMANGPVVGTTQFSNGLLDFSSAFPNFQFTSGNSGNDVTLSIKAGTGTNCGTDAICTGTSPALTLRTSTITAGPLVEQATVSSLINFSPGQLVFDFRVFDDDLVIAGTDALPTLISDMVITQLAGNDIADWTQIIAGARLDDGTGNILFGTVNATNITFSGMNTAPGGLGHVADNGIKNYRLRVWLHTTPGGTLPATMDNLNLAFEALASNLTLAGSSSTFGPNESENSGATNNALDVDATKLAFTTNPAADILVNKDISLQPPVPVVQALDANNNRDLDYNSATVTVTNAGALPMSNTPGNASIVSGLLTFANNFQYDAVGDGTLTVASTGPTIVTPAQSTAVNVRVAVSGTITAGGGLEPPTISSLVDTDPEKVQAFDFTITDDDGLAPGDPENDGNPILITQITITQQSPNNTIANWADAIASATLSDGTNTLTGTVSTNTITFSGISTGVGALGHIADNGNKTYRLIIYLKSALGGTLPVTIDGLQFGFQVLQADIITSSAGTNIKPGESEHSGSNNEVTVVATQLDVTTPAASTAVSINTAFTPVIQARDVNGNRDLDFEGATAEVTEFTNASGATMSNGPVVGTTQFTDGLLDFSASFPNFQFTTGNNNDNVTLSVKAGTGTTCGTNAICTVINPVLTLKSSTITAGSGVELSSISSLSTVNPGAFVFDFTINDDDLVAAGTDGLPTLISQVMITKLVGNDVADWSELIDVAMLEDGVNSHVGTVSANNITFTGMSTVFGALGYVDDNQAKNYRLWITLKTALGGTLPSTVDNQNIAFEVLATNLTLAGSSSTFSTSESESSGAGNNAIDVTATQLLFTTNPAPDILVNKDISLQPPVPVVEALDANNNRDLDYNSATVTVTNQGGLPMSNAPGNASIVNGLLTFANDFQYNAIGDGTLTVASTGPSAVTNALSTAVTVRVGISGTITAGGGAEPATLSSLVDTDAEKVQVFDFTITDDDGLAPTDIQNDGNPMLITQILITAQANPNNTIADWSEAIAAAELFDGTNTVAGVVSAGSIAFNLPIAIGTAGYIADDDDKTYSMRVYLKNVLGGSLPVTIDGQQLAFQVLAADIVTDPNGTSLLAGQNENSGSGTEVTVVATSLDFTTPSLASEASLNSPFAVVVEARDANANRDLDFTAAAGTITALTNVSGNDMDNDPVIGTSQFTAGVFVFDPNFQFVSGDDQDDVTLTIKAGGGTNCGVNAICGTSPTIVLQSSFESSLVADPTFAFPSAIDYVSHIENVDIQNTPSSYELGRLLLVDGSRLGHMYVGPSGSGLLTTNTDALDGQPNADSDGAPTNLTSITIRIHNPSNIRRIALYSNGTELPGTETDVAAIGAITPTTAFHDFVFTGAPLLVASDNSEAELSIRVSFRQTTPEVMDHEELKMELMAASVTGGSQFFIGPPAGTYVAGQLNPWESPDGTNVVEVVATSLDFVLPPSRYAGIDEPIGPDFTDAPFPETRAAVVHARDRFMVLDLDFDVDASQIILTGGGVTSSASFVDGILDLDGMEYTTPGDGKLIVEANGLNSESPGPENFGNSIRAQPVDVIHVSAVEVTNGVLTTPNIRGGTPNTVIFGVTIYPEHNTNLTPSLKRFTFSFDHPYRTADTTILLNFKVYQNTDSTFENSVQIAPALVTEVSSESNTDFDLITVDFGADSVRLYNPINGDVAAKTFYLVADVHPTANIGTRKLTPQLIDGGYESETDDHIILTRGTATSAVIGKTYAFATTRPPFLVSNECEPFNGQLNVDAGITQIKLKFDVQVWSLDGVGELYNRTSNRKVAELVAINGNYNDLGATAPTVNPLIFDIVFLPNEQFYADSVYYVTIKKGEINNNVAAGISDNGFNFYGGITSNGTMYFKISSENPPKLMDAKPYYSNLSSGSFSTHFDQRGTAYYLVLDHQQFVNNGSVAPQNADIESPTTYALNHPGSFVTAGSYEITQVNELQTVSFGASLTAGRVYDIWIFAQNDANPTPKRTTAPYGAGTAYAVGGAGPTLQLSVKASLDNDDYSHKPSYLLCPDSYYNVTAPIVIGELANGDFQSASVQDFNILLPTGYEFDGLTLPSVFLVGQDFDQNSLNVEFINNTIINVSYFNNGSASLDNIIITNLRLIGAAGSIPGKIIRFAGNADLGGISELADVSIKLSDEQKFTNSYTVNNDFVPFGFKPDAIITAIPDNYVDEIDPTLEPGQVRLFPLIKPANDYGSSLFGGNGVTNDILSLSAVAVGSAFDITMTHAGVNGCISETSVQYLVYDHRSPISVKLGLSANGTQQALINPAFPNPAPAVVFPNTSLPEFQYEELAGYRLIELFCNIAANTGQIINGPDWQNQVQQIPVVTGSVQTSNIPNLPVGFYRTYQWDYNRILNAATESLTNNPNTTITKNPYDNFVSLTPKNQSYWKGGSLGRVEFTGTFQSKADLSVLVPFRQQVELFVPPIPVIEVDESNQPVKGITTYCEAGGGIVINGYPAAAAGASTGVFRIFNASDNAPLQDSAPNSAFVDNGNGTATIYPFLLDEFNEDIGIKNNYQPIRITYTYKDDDSPIDGVGEIIIRITPNPVADFSYSSYTCAGADVAFTGALSIAAPFSAGDISSVAWNFDDQNAGGGNSNTSDLQNPTHVFRDAGLYNVTLSATSVFGCASVVESQQVVIGANPSVAFEFTGVSTDEPIEFISNSSVEQNTPNPVIASEAWDFGEGLPESGNIVSHQYMSPGIYNVSLTVTTAIGCIGTTDQHIVVVPQFDATDTAPFEETFESGNGGWQVWAEEDSEADTTSWKHGLPSGNVIIGNSAAWTTGSVNAAPPVPYNGKERSALYSPVFDISDLARPMISFNSFVQLENSDGVVLEYSTDNYNITDPRKVWTSLGDIDGSGISSGVDWYNGTNLASQPGEQTINFFGWTETPNTDEDPEFEWLESKHSLGAVAGAQRISFRFALGSTNEQTTRDGFAVDNVRIGNRTRIVLLENFTNLGNSLMHPTETDEFLEDYENENLKTFNPSGTAQSVVLVNYHVGFPNQDPINLDNPQDPGARALYYNISKTPRVRMDGAGADQNPDALFTEWGETAYNRRSLKLADARITVDFDAVNEELSINVTALKDLPENTILHVALVENTIDRAQLADPGNLIKRNEDEFSYVLKKLLPSAAGTRFNQVLPNASPRTFGPFAINERLKLYLPTNDLSIVVFLQNEDNKEIYQTEIIDLDDPSVVTSVEDSRDKYFNVFPNPADKEMIVELPEVAMQKATLKVFDQMGKVVNETGFEKGEYRKVIDTGDFAAGVYLIQVATPEGILRRKVMVIHSR